jgi:sRNA-binding regulator protein Hfq
MTFEVDKSFHETHVTIHLVNGVKVLGVMTIDAEGKVWMPTLNGMQKQQVNPLAISTVMPSQPKQHYKYNSDFVL